MTSPRLSGEQHRRLIEASSHAMALLDLSGRFRYYNGACALLFERSPEDFDEGRLATFLQVDDHERLACELAERHGRHRRWRDETFARRQDGSIFPISIIFTPLPPQEDGDPLLLAEFDDPTDCSSTVARLVQTERLAALGEMVSSLSHELNNPLAIICGYAELLAETAEDDPGATYALTISKQAERCRVIVSKLMSFSRIQEASPSVVKLNDLVRDGLDLLAYELRTRSIHVDLDLSERLPPTWGDAHKLLQAILVLVQNAMDAMAERGRGRLSIRTSCATGPALIIDVADDGPGVPADRKHKIFQPFYTTKKGCNGSGLGLSLAYGVVKEHGGWLAEIGNGKGGACFRIWLPLRLPESVERRPPKTPDDPLLPPTDHAPHVLVLDDENEVCGLLRRILEKQGWTVDCCQSVTDGLEILSQKRVDLIFCDIHMPDRSGFEFLDEVARRKPALVNRIIFCTGDGLHPRTARLMAESGRPIVHKPFRRESIIEEGLRTLERERTPEAPEGVEGPEDAR